MTVRGGHKFRAAINKAIRASGVESVRIGWQDGTVYADGTPVATVALAHEFGTFKHNETAVFRRALIHSRDDVRELIVRRIDAESLAVSETLAQEIGDVVRRQLQHEIEQAGLIDTQLMHDSVSVRVGR